MVIIQSEKKHKICRGPSKHSYTEMQKSNKSTVPLLEFMLSAPIGFSDEERTVNFYGR
jgi:hypothetical protein